MKLRKSTATRGRRLGRDAGELWLARTTPEPSPRARRTRVVRQKAVFITANADTTTDAERLEAEVSILFYFRTVMAIR